MRCGPPGVGRVGSAPQGADCVRLPCPWTGSPVSSTQGRRQQRGAVAHTDHEAEPGHLHSVVPWSPQRPEEPDHSFLCTCDLLSGPRAPDPALASGSPSSEEARPPPPGLSRLGSVSPVLWRRLVGRLGVGTPAPDCEGFVPMQFSSTVQKAGFHRAELYSSTFYHPALRCPVW